MSKYYNPKRTRNLYDPKSKEPYKLSRSAIELFMGCPRCFYIDKRLGTARPPGFPFSLNSAVDNLLKKEFDVLRAKKAPHPLLKANGVDGVPAINDKIDEWRNSFKGVRYKHEKTNLLIFGAIDDVLEASNGEYILIEFKATSKNEAITGLTEAHHESYKRQIEIYQWLLRKNGYKVSDTSYFFYCNGLRNEESFDRKLEFEISIIPYEGSDKWVEETILSAHKCLNESDPPPPDKDCDYCAYKSAVKSVLKKPVSP